MSELIMFYFWSDSQIFVPFVKQKKERYYFSVLIRFAITFDFVEHPEAD